MVENISHTKNPSTGLYYEITTYKIKDNCIGIIGTKCCKVNKPLIIKTDTIIRNYKNYKVISFINLIE